MGNIDNKEKEFAETLKYVTRLARENRNIISREQVDDAFSELDLDRQKRLLKFVSRTQTFITCTDERKIDGKFLFLNFKT